MTRTLAVRGQIEFGLDEERDTGGLPNFLKDFK